MSIKILIVDESMLFRSMFAREIRNLVTGEVDVDKVGDGHEALRRISDSEPNGILVNMRLPGMSGLDFVREVKRKYKSKVIAVSTMESDRGLATSAGADEFIIKPVGLAASKTEFLQMLAQKVIELSKGVNVYATPAKAPKASPASSFSRASSFGSFSSGGGRGGSSWCKLVAIGSSTGGTEALSEVLSHLSAPMPPILVVQHISPTFSKLFADRLDSECPLKVKEAENGEIAQDNTIYIAPGDKHMSITCSGDTITINCRAGARIHGVTTSADVLFESVAKLIGNQAVGVILTGMGMDGAAQLLEMRKAGARTLGQDEASCVVYGMPKAAFNMGAVERQVSLTNMAKEITALVRNI